MTRVRAAGRRNPRAAALAGRADDIARRLQFDSADPVARAEAHELLSQTAAPGGLEDKLGDSLAAIARIADVATSDAALAATAAVSVTGIAAAAPTAGASLGATVAAGTAFGAQQLVRRAVRPLAHRITRWAVRQAARNAADGRSPGFAARVILRARSRYLRRTGTPAGYSANVAASRKPGMHQPTRASRTSRAAEAMYRIGRGTLEGARIAAQLGATAAGAGIQAATAPQNIRPAVMNKRLVNAAERNVLRDRRAARGGNSATPGGSGNRLGRAAASYRGDPRQPSRTHADAKRRATAARNLARGEARQRANRQKDRDTRANARHAS